MISDCQFRIAKMEEQKSEIRDKTLVLRSAADCSYHGFAGGAGGYVLPGVVIVIGGFQDAAGFVVFNYCLDSQLIRLAFELIKDKREIPIGILVLFLYPGVEHAGFCI